MYILSTAVGFSVKGIKEVSYNAMTFSHTITNVDRSYNEATGVFTCKIPGHYYISTSLLKHDNYQGHAYCSIYKNNVPLVWAYTRPGDSPYHGYTAAVVSTYTHLAVGGTVKLANCSWTASWNIDSGYSSFSGFLVTPDAA